MKPARPVHKVELDGFYVDTYGGRWGNSGSLCGRTATTMKGIGIIWFEDLPEDEYSMVYVNWNDATTYAKWEGKRLSTEVEWEYIARGGLVGKWYPWGDGIDKTKANYNK